MKTKESSLWGWLKKGRLKLNTELLDLERVENTAGTGMPDVEGFYGSQFWIELKTCGRPKKPTTKVRPIFQPGQIPWLKRRWGIGGKAWCLIQVGSGHQARRYLIAGHYIEHFENGQPEDVFRHYSVIQPNLTAKDIILRASWQPRQ